MNSFTQPFSGSSFHSRVIRHVLITLFTLGMASASAAAERSPDIILFIADDLGYYDSEPYGATDHATPNIAELAADGLRFTGAYVASPTCGPSRAALLSGLMPQRNGIEPNHDTEPLPGVASMLHGFADLGYEVAAFGKVAHGNTRRDPWDHGFTHRGSYRLDMDEVERFLRERNGDKPLLLMVGTRPPHVPWPEESRYQPDKVALPPGSVDTPETRVARTRYYESIHRMDDSLGELRALVERYLSGRDPLFLFTSDHGAQWPFSKWNLYEDAIRSPLIAHWPGRVPAGESIDTMVSWVDILPTLMEVAGGSPNADLDGRSFLGVLNGDTRQHRSEIFASHTGATYNVYPMRSVRSGRWKYIRNLHPEFVQTNQMTEGQSKGGGAFWDSWREAARTDPAARALVERYYLRSAEELYDLEADPHEQVNLAADPRYAGQLSTLSARIDRYMEETADTALVHDTPVLRQYWDEDALAARTDPERPNFVIIFTDDLGYGDIGAFGAEDIATPHIDRLAGDGVRYTDFYSVSAVCSPSRAGLLTGRLPVRMGINAVFWPESFTGMPETEITIADLLHERGYRSTVIGKWHLGHHDRFLPLQRGFDEFYGVPYSNGMASVAVMRGNRVEDFHPDQSQFTRRFTEEAVSFIQRNNGTPFFLFLAHPMPHVPIYASEAFTGSSQRGLYGDVIQELDWSVGQVVAALKQTGQLDNTLVVFTSDNGPWIEYKAEGGSSGPLRDGKFSTFEGGIRMPTAARWPHGYASEQDVTEPLWMADWLPTMADMAGIELPADRDYDGISLVPLARGGDKPAERNLLFYQAGKLEAMRRGRWKIKLPFDGRKKKLVQLNWPGGIPAHELLLFDMENDPGEQNDLSARHPDIVTDLMSHLEAEVERLGTLPPDLVVRTKPDEEYKLEHQKRLEELEAQEGVP